MQTPTLPTKPTPPTPPTMNMKPPASSNTEPSTSPPISNSSSASKLQTTETPKESKTTSAPPSALEKSVSVDKNMSPPQPPFGTYQETSSQTTSAPTIPASKKQSPLGFGFFFSLVLLVGIAFVCFRLWRNNQNAPKESRTILDYSTDTSKDLLDLMNSSTTNTPPPQTIVQGKGKSSSKIKGNFEVRI